MVLQKKCNKCGFIGHLDYFVKSSGYKYGRRPLCKMCKFKYQRKLLGKEEIEWNPRGFKEKEELNITPEGLELLINSGFASSREEALKYIQ